MRGNKRSGLDIGGRGFGGIRKRGDGKVYEGGSKGKEGENTANQGKMKGKDEGKKWD